MKTECKNASAGRARPDATQLQAADQLNASLNQAQALLCLLLTDGFEHEFSSAHADVMQVLALVLQATGRADVAGKQLRQVKHHTAAAGRLNGALTSMQALVRVLTNTSINCSITGPGFGPQNTVVLDALMLAADLVETAQQAAQSLEPLRSIGQ